MENSMLYFSRQKRLRLIWKSFIEAQRSIIVAGMLAMLCLLVLAISTYTVLRTTSKVVVRTLSQQHSLQPDFIDAIGGPLEMAGSMRCGSFPSQAEELGCIFDLMNYGFTPPECFYEDLYQEALSKGPWPWYIDGRFNVSLPQDDTILMRSVDVWSNMQYHYEHCKYTQKVVARALHDDSALIPQYFAHDIHRDHCIELIGRYESGGWGTGDRVNTWIRMKYNPCVRLSEINKKSLKFV
jgi:hypothetical protein